MLHPAILAELCPHNAFIGIGYAHTGVLLASPAWRGSMRELSAREFPGPLWAKPAVDAVLILFP
jgi:hypothetical protein